MKPGSLPRCVMAVVACADEVALAAALARLRRDRGLAGDFEFHYVRATDSLREAFMDVLADQAVHATVAIYEKDRLRPRWAWGRDTGLLLQLVVHCALAFPAGTLGGARMLIDGDREARALIKILRPALSHALAERGGTERLTRMTHGDSTRHDILQVADMFSGALAAASKRRVQHTTFLGRARGRVTVLPIAPEMEKPIK